MTLIKRIPGLRSSLVGCTGAAGACRPMVVLALSLLLAACASTSDTDCPDSQRSASGECRATGAYEWSDTAAQEAQRRFEDSRPGRR